ncbi:MAG: 2-amino-4-hydroxy-6-hydroxymethyldihydropteridine diphosphokinase [Candidatus Acidiferrales bacterium]
METAYLSLGSNMGDREANLARAVEELRRRGVHILRQSSLYETEPLEIRQQAWFLNYVVEIETTATPSELLAMLLEIEREMGRLRGTKYGPRLIDMDILLYGATVVDTPELTVPHPKMTERRFVLVPLNELASDIRHPVLRKTIAELLAETPDQSQVRVWRP